VSSVLSHWVLPYFAVASAPFETCLLENLPCDIISHHNVLPDYDNDHYNGTLQHYHLFLVINYAFTFSTIVMTIISNYHVIQ
jgi:hypothetical protein